MPGFTDDFKGVFLSGNFDKDMRFFKELFKNDGVFRSRNIRPAGSDVSFFVMFMDGMTNCSVTADNIIKPLTLLCERDRVKLTARYVGERVIFSGEVSYKRDLSEIVSSVLIGDTAVLISGSDTALIVNTKGFPARSVVEPVDERVTQGPREGFLEVAMYNLSLIRRRLLTPDLIIKPVKAGKRSNTAVFVCYLGTLADKNTVDELLRRIDAVDIDGVLDSNYLTEHIRNRKMSIFKTIGTTERPDIVAARLLPWWLTVPRWCSRYPIFFRKIFNRTRIIT